ncbi:MAG: tail fiber protein [Chitinophagaceae bacterium]|nr:tail fiber protein [Chitinophagaceae bacterium]
MRIFTILFLLFCGLCLHVHAQTGIGTNTPDGHAMVDISSTQKGVLLPKLNAAQQTVLQGLLTSAQTGMLILDSVSGKIVFWTGSAGTGWKDLSTLTVTASSPLSVSSINNIALNPGTSVGDLITWDGVNWVNMQPAVQNFNITVDNRQPTLTLNYCIALQGIFPSRNGNEPFLAEIELFSFNFAPKGWTQCNGQLLPINQNQALFSLLGTTYGGNGQTNFALPNLQGRVPMHYGQGSGLSNFTLGQTGGAEQNTITR